jgi:hygromycin-B 4-O-kinase
VSEAIDPDLTSVTSHLAARFGSVAALTPLEGGEWSRAFAFRAGARELVLRIGSVEEDYEKDRVAASWRRDGLPVATILETGEIGGIAYAISERVHGSAIEELDRTGWRRVLPHLFDALAAMREIDLPGRGYGRWTPNGSAPHRSWREWLLSIADEPLDPRIRGWRDHVASVPGARDRFERCYAALVDAARHAPEVRHVVHADLTARNVLVTDSRISAVLDWANSLAGDPLYDVAWLLFWAPWHPGIDPDELRATARERFDDTDFDARVRCCGLHVGLDAQLYTAFRRRLDELERASARTLEVAAAGL